MNAKQVILYTLLAVGAVLAIYTLFLIRDVLILIFIGILFATAIAPLVERLRSRLGRGQAVLVVYLAIALSLGFFLYFLFRAVLEQSAALVNNLPGLIGTLQAFVDTIDVPFLRQLLHDFLAEASANLGVGAPNGQAGAAGGVAQGVFSVTVSLFTAAFGFFTVLVVGYYWIVERPAVLRLFVSLFPAEQRAIARKIFEDIEAKLGAWVRAQLALMGLIAVLFAIGYSVLGLKYALLLAVFAGLAEIIPFLGPWIGAAPAVIVALSQSVWLAVAVAVYSAIIQVLEGNILVPRILGSSIGISPLVVIIALLVGASLMGIAGALLAVPIASAVQVIIESLLLHPVPIAPDQDPPIPAAPSALQVANQESWLNRLRRLGRRD